MKTSNAVGRVMDRLRRPERLRGGYFDAIRRAHFAADPLCAHCRARGRTTLATQLDHIVALVNGGPDFDADGGNNRQGLCAECHVVKTALDLGYEPRRRETIGRDGWPVFSDTSPKPRNHVGAAIDPLGYPPPRLSRNGRVGGQK